MKADLRPQMRLGQAMPMPGFAEPTRVAAGGFPGWLRSAFLFLALYLVLPVFDVPLMALSFSAPVFFVVAIPALLRPPSPWLNSYRGWIAAAAAIWLGMFTSAVLNGLTSEGTRIDRDGLVSLIQYAYWLLVFVVTTYLVSAQRIGRRTAEVLATGVAILALMRWGEAIFGGSIGAWMHLMILTQNNYAIIFSTFGGVLFAFVFRRRISLATALAVVALWGAVLINGSRAGWLAAIASMFTFIWMFMLTQPKGTRVLGVTMFLMAGLGMGALLAPENMAAAFTDRAATIQTLDEDKSYAIRVLMNQKGIKLFQASPWIGVGTSRWRKESIPLEMPRILDYAPQGHFDRKSSHNSYIQFLAENGLVGSIPLGLLLSVLVIRGYRAALRLARQGEVWPIGIFAGFIGMGIHLWALSGLTGTVTWFVFGLVAAIIELDRRQTAALGVQ